MPIPTIQETAGVIADPELRFTPQGKAVLSIRLAFNDSKYNEETRQWENAKTFYVDATAWEQTAERLADQIRKGDQVYVSGRLETQSWEKDGEKKSKPSLTVRTMRKLEKNAPTQQQAGGGNFAPARSAGFGAPQPPAQPQQDPWSGGQQQTAWGEPAQGGPAPF